MPVYLVIKRVHFLEEGWPGYIDFITEPAYINSKAARVRVTELVALFETDEKRKTLAALGTTRVDFYLRDVSLVQEMKQ